MHIPPHSPFGCTGELAEYLRSISFTPDQERGTSRAIEMAIRMARAKGEEIDSDEAMRRISQRWLDDHEAVARPAGKAEDAGR